MKKPLIKIKTGVPLSHDEENNLMAYPMQDYNSHRREFEPVAKNVQHVIKPILEDLGIDKNSLQFDIEAVFESHPDNMLILSVGYDEDGEKQLELSEFGTVTQMLNAAIEESAKIQKKSAKLIAEGVPHEIGSDKNKRDKENYVYSQNLHAVEITNRLSSVGKNTGKVSEVSLCVNGEDEVVFTLCGRQRNQAVNDDKKQKEQYDGVIRCVDDDMRIAKVKLRWDKGQPIKYVKYDRRYRDLLVKAQLQSSRCKIEAAPMDKVLSFSGNSVEYMLKKIDFPNRNLM